MKTKQQIANELVDAIISNLCARDGGAYFFSGSCDEKEQNEIRAAWAAILAPHVAVEAADRVMGALVDGPPPYVVAAIAALNSALDADPGAMTRLLEMRFPCTEALAAHPTVRVRKDAFGEGSTVGMLGVINGCLGVIPSGPRKGGGWVSVQEDEDGPICFVLTTDAPLPDGNDVPPSGG